MEFKQVIICCNVSLSCLLVLIMKMRISLLLILHPVIMIAGCAHNEVKIQPYASSKGFSFVINDGTGLYASKTQYYLPIHCGNKLKELHIDIGQDKFDEIEKIVESTDLWSAQASDIPGCRPIEPEPDGDYYQFTSPTRQVTLSIPYCSRVDEKYKTPLDTIRSIIRTESDKHEIKVGYHCIKF